MLSCHHAVTLSHSTVTFCVQSEGDYVDANMVSSYIKSDRHPVGYSGNQHGGSAERPVDPRDYQRTDTYQDSNLLYKRQHNETTTPSHILPNGNSDHINDNDAQAGR